MGNQAFTDAQDLTDLQTAIDLLETTAITHRLAQISQQPLATYSHVATDYTSLYLYNAVQHALSAAISQLVLEPPAASPTLPLNAHSTFTAISGAVGGSFGFAGSILELPLAIRLLLQSIVQIAAYHQFCLSDSATRRACMIIFALNGTSPKQEPSNTSTYFLTRDHLDELTANQTTQQDASSICNTLLKHVALRFSQSLVEKMALQSQQPLSRKTAEKINAVFISHYLSMAQGHFIIQRLEKKYQQDPVREAYHRLHQPKT